MASSGRNSELPRRRAAINASLKLKELCRRNVRAKKNVAGSKSCFPVVQSEAVLPIELIGDILSRLPPKYLIRLQLVCKEWKTLILGHYFMERYKECYTNIQCWYNETNNQPSINEGRSPSLVFGFDGLLLLRSENLKYFLWNPATRLILELPNPNHENNGNCVFTYVPATKSYRLVSIHKDKKSGVEGCEVLTPGTSNKWRSLKFPATVYPVDRHKNRERTSIVLAGAAVHYTRVLEYGKEVVSLDVASECFIVNSLPKTLSNWKKARALDWEGKFAFAEKDGENLMVLVLENYKKNKWGRKMKISLLPLMKKKIVGEGDHLVPLFTKNGVLWIWLEGKKIFTFNIETGEAVDIGKISFLATAEKFYPYKPSFVTFQEMKPDTQFQNLRALIL